MNEMDVRSSTQLYREYHGFVKVRNYSFGIAAFCCLSAVFAYARQMDRLRKFFHAGAGASTITGIVATILKPEAPQRPINRNDEGNSGTGPQQQPLYPVVYPSSYPPQPIPYYQPYSSALPPPYPVNVYPQPPSGLYPGPTSQPFFVPPPMLFDNTPSIKQGFDCFMKCARDENGHRHSFPCNPQSCIVTIQSDPYVIWEWDVPAHILQELSKDSSFVYVCPLELPWTQGSMGATFEISSSVTGTWPFTQRKIDFHLKLLPVSQPLTQSYTLQLYPGHETRTPLINKTNISLNPKSAGTEEKSVLLNTTSHSFNGESVYHIRFSLNCSEWQKQIVQ
jgi:hypothetical protein